MIKAAALTTAFILLASATPVRGEPTAALWLDRGADGPAEPALLLETEVFIEVTGMLAYSTVEQRFVNDSDQWAEGHYRFPLPDDSAVESLIVRVGERLIEGEIQERGQARETYDQARRSGRVAGLVEHDGGSEFKTSVANIPPGEDVVIQIGFRQVVDYRHGRFNLRFPTTIAPRFSAQGEVTTAEPHRFTDESRPFKLTVDLWAGVELAALESSFHPIETEYEGGRWRVRMVGSDQGAGHDNRYNNRYDDRYAKRYDTRDDNRQNGRKDFELIWRPAGRDGVTSTVFRQRLGGKDHALVLIVPPERFDTQRTPREVILVIDTSGSMQGDAIVQARASLLFALDQLSGGDRFNVIEFDSETRSLFPQPEPASQSSVERARDFIHGLVADGGTVMAPALMQAMTPESPPGFLRQIVFVTDGNIANEDELIRTVRRQIGASRLFSVGIGHGVNSQFLDDAARHGRGTFTFIGERHQVHQRMTELTRQLTQPVLHDIELFWADPVEQHPQRIPDLYAGQPLMVSVRGDRLSGELLVVGTSDGRAWQETVPLETFGNAPGVAAHWGSMAIRAELDRRYLEADSDQLRRRALDLALEYQLLSPYTSLVAVDRTPARSRQMALRRHELATLLPHGHAGEMATAGGLRLMPATDGGSGASVLRGLLALLLVGLLLGHKRLSRDTDNWSAR